MSKSIILLVLVGMMMGAFARLAARDGTALAAVQSATYYVRPDGGSPEQCTGLTDAPYPGGGLHQDCAWDHPFRALPPDGPVRIQGGDTLIIAAGSYRMGYGAPEADGDGDQCASAYPWGCVMPPIPSGPDADHPTRILGAGWDSGCADPPELWGAERAAHILDLTDSQHVQIACLEITDHAGCVEFHSGDIACPRDAYPYGDWAPTGVYAQDASDIHLQDLNIHGLAHTGVWAGRLRDWRVTNVRIAGNGWVGWDGDIDGEDSNSGSLRFRLWTVEWNGCGETWPEGEPVGCWAQSAGGYGDGVGTGATGGDWIIEDSAFLHNTSDGLDLLYHTGGGGVTLTNVRAEGNAGNQIKTTGAVTLTNSVLVGNCAYFDDQPFTYNVDPCRALGNTLSLSFMGGEQITLTNNTFYGQGDGLVSAGPHGDGDCTGSERITGRNNLYQGDDDYFQQGDITFLFYYEDCPGLDFDGDYSLYNHVKLSAYAPGPHDIEADPQLTGPLSGDYYGMAITATSPARDAGLADVAPATDFLHLSRDASPDIGAYEYQTNPVYLPRVTITRLNASDARLAWERPDDAYLRFHVFRDIHPYFQPDERAVAVIDAPPWQWDDAGALGDPAQNRYYLIQGERFDHGRTDSNRVGEFDFALTPGAP